MRLIDADALWMDVIRSVDYCDDILKFIERQPTVEQPHWIPCSERLPEDDGKYLCCWQGISVGTGMFLNGYFRLYGEIKDNLVTAWQPLPSPYREEADE